MFRFAILLLLLVADCAHASCSVHRVAVLPITLWQQKLFVPVEVDGAPSMFFVDTGASVTTLANSLSDRLTLPRDHDRTLDMFGVGGKESHLYIAHTNDLGIGTIHFAGQSFPVAEFDQRLSDNAPIGGLIGADILSRFDVDLDVPGRRLGLWQVSGCTELQPDWQHSFGNAALEVAPSGHASVPVKVDGVTLDLTIDTGAPALILSSRAAARAGVTPDILDENRRLVGHGVNDRPFSAWLHIFNRLDVAGQVFGNVRSIVVAPGRMQTGDGLLGLDLLKRTRVWLSYSTGRIFIETAS